MKKYKVDFILAKETIFTVLKKAENTLKKQGIVNAKLSSQMLLAHVLKIKKSDLFLYYDKALSQKEISKYFALIDKRKKNIPIEYILKEVDFYGVKIYLNQNVLIPRQETEILVDLIAKELEKEPLKDKVLLDLCTGSGAIAIALKKRFKDLKVIASDISNKALYVAKKNAKKNGVKIFFKRSDLLNSFKNIKVDFLVSNPPYVSEKEFEKLDESVLNFEPILALKAKDDGLEFYKKIEKQIFKVAKKNTKLFFEIGYKQKKGLFKIFSDKKYIKKKLLKDFSQKDRFFFVEIE